MPTYTYASCATRGQRSYQEDAAAVWPGKATFEWELDLPAPPNGSLIAVLADGMGGHAGGAQASTTACRKFLEACASRDEPFPARLVGALARANDGISKMVADRPELEGMGTTLVGASFSEAGLEWVSVGDSPMYLYRREELALLNEDHSLAPALDQLAAEGKISADAARNDPRRHMLRSAVTGDELELVDISREALVLGEGDVVILASDGIHAIDQDEIVRIVRAYGTDGPYAIAQALIRAVENQRDPHQDNTTVVVVQPVGT
ncbi:MAG: serine/threonine-protein phosphatase [Hyphomicrobiaceae bacterium]|nr:serine/threonine-protein phosphatase [Hyphomicrobiaceae bacterium]